MSPWARRGIYAAALLVAAQLSAATTVVEPGLVLCSPGAGIGVLFLMGTWGTRQVRADALVLWLAAAATLLVQGAPVPVAAAVGTIAVVTSALACGVLARLRPDGLQLRTPLDLAILSAAAATGGLLLAVLSTVSRTRTDVATGEPLGGGVAVSLALGMAVLLATQLGTCLTAVGWLRLRDAARGTVVEAAPAGPTERTLLWVAGLLGSVVALGGVVPTAVPIAWASVPFAVWAGLRLRTSEAALYAASVIAVGVGGLMMDRGPFSDASVIPATTGLLSYLTVATSLTLLLALGRDERVALAASIAAQADLLDAIHGATSDAVAVFDADGQVLLHNRAAEALVGSSLEATGRRHAVRAADGGPLAPADYPVSRALRGEHVDDVDLLAAPPGAAPRVLSASAHPLPHTAGAAWSGGAVLSYRDVTAARAASAEVAAARDLYSAVLEAAVEQSIVGVDLSGRITVFNAGAERLTGWTAAEVVGRGVELLHDAAELTDRAAPLGLEPGLPVLVHPLEEHRVHTSPWTLVTRHGDRRCVMLSVAALHAPDGTTTGYLLIGSDVTERLDAERRLADSEELFRLAFDESPLGLGVVSLDPTDLGQLVRANAAMARICGHAQEDLLGSPTSGLMAAEDAADHLALLRALLDDQAGPQAGSGTDDRTRAVRLLHPDGATRWGRVTAAVLHTDGSAAPSALVLLEDITSRREAEDALQHLASHDALTGLPNRALMADQLDLTLVRAARGGDDASFALLFLDLDGFKAVNDQHGHVAGDQLLCEVARRLESRVRGDDTVARLGGDEFAVLCRYLPEDRVTVLVQRLQQAVAMPVELADGAQVRVGVSIGVAAWDGSSTAEQLLDHADRAMYESKRRRRAAADPGRTVLTTT